MNVQKNLTTKNKIIILFAINACAALFTALFAIYLFRNVGADLQNAADAEFQLTIFGAAALVIAAAISVPLILSVASPFEKLKQTLSFMSSGESTEMPAIDKDSEIGRVFDSVASIGSNLDAINRTQAVIRFELSGHIINANENFLKTVGYDLSEIQGRHHAMFVTPEYRAGLEYRAFWEKLNTGVFDSGEYKRVGKNGKVIWIFAHYVPILNAAGKPTGVIKFASDITQEVLKREEEAERQKQIDMISLVASKNENMVLITDKHERIEYVNEAFERLTGYGSEEVIGRNPNFLQGADTDPETKKRIREKLGAKRPFTEEILNYRKDGAPYWVSLAVNPVFDDTGDVLHFIAFQSDITANKIAALENEKGQNEVVRILNNLSEGDLTAKMEGSYKGTFAGVKSAVNQTIDRLRGIAGDLQTATRELDGNSQQIAQSGDELSGRTESQAATLEEINATMTEFTQTVRNNNALAEQSGAFAGDAKRIASDGGEVLNNLLRSMANISESSQKIVDIIGVIDTIASQTNLLALNAAVEAARAGEAGRGFAVVASEVRTLAGRSAKASNEIKNLITESVERVSSGTQLADRAGDSLKQIIEAVTQLAEQVTDIAKAGREQSASLSEIGAALGSMDSVTQQNSQMANKSAYSSQELKKLAQNLNRLIAFFKTEGADIDALNTAFDYRDAA